MKFLLATIIMFSFVVVPNSTNAKAKKSKAGKLSYNPKKVKTRRYPKAKVVVYKRKALPVLSLRHVARLSHSQRVKYLKSLTAAYANREMVTREYIRGKKFEKIRNKRKKNAGLDFDSIWLRLLTPEVAEALELPGAREANGYGICAGRIEKSSGKGAGKVACSGRQKCGFVSFGLQGADAFVNITDGNRGGATDHECTRRAESLAIKNASLIGKAKTQYEEVMRGQNVSLEQKLKVLQDNKVLENNLTADYGMRAHVFHLAGEYLEEGKQIPAYLNAFTSDDPILNKINESTLLKWLRAARDGREIDFESEYNADISNLDDSYFGVSMTCFRPMGQEVAAGAKGGSGPYKEPEANIAKDCRDRKGTRPADCFYWDECNMIKRDKGGVATKFWDKYKKTHGDMQDVADTLPVEELPMDGDASGDAAASGNGATGEGATAASGDGNDLATGDTATLDVTPLLMTEQDGEDRIPAGVEVYQRDPDKPLNSREGSDSFGCANLLVRHPNIEPSPMSCLACSMKMDKMNYEKIKADKAGVDPDTVEDYTPSSKWNTLLSIAARVCGDNDADSTRHMHFSVASKYMQTFGHCDESTFDWGGGYQKESHLFQNYDLDDLVTKNYEEGDSKRKSLDVIRDYYEARDIRGMSGGNIDDDESSKEYINRMFEEMFGLNYKGNSTGFLWTYKKFPGVKDIFCPGDKDEVMNQSSTQRREGMRASIARLKKYHGNLKTKGASGRRGSTKATNKANMLEPLLSCMEESLDNAETLYKNEIPGGSLKSKTDVGCYSTRKSTPSRSKLTTDVPLVGFQETGACFTSHDVEWGEAEDVVTTSHPTRRGRPLGNGKMTFKSKPTICTRGACGDIQRVAYNKCSVQQLFDEGFGQYRTKARSGESGESETTN